jgi:hypothetical protein
MQVVHQNSDVFRAIASFEEQPRLKNGDRVNRPFTSVPTPKTYTRGTAVTMQDITVSEEYLTVDVAKVTPFYVDDLDELQSNYPLVNRLADECAVKLGNWIDGDVLGEYAQADDSIDDGDLGGTAGNGVTVTTSNIGNIFAAAQRKLHSQLKGSYKENQMFAVISPHFRELLLRYLAGKESALGDSSGLNGHVGRYFGFDLYVSTGTACSARLEFGTLPIDADTVVINGVTWTFKDSIGTTAGNVHIGASTAAVALDCLVAAINSPDTGITEAAGAGHVALSAANAALMDGITATDGTTYMTIIAEGKGTCAVSEALSAPADIWTATKQVQHQLFGKKGAIDVVIQARPTVEIKQVPDKLGVNVIPYTLYGLKTFDEGDAALIDVQMRSDAF